MCVACRSPELTVADANTESVGAALAETDIPRDQLFITDKLSKGIKDVRGTLKASLKSAYASQCGLTVQKWDWNTSTCPAHRTTLLTA